MSCLSCKIHLGVVNLKSQSKDYKVVVFIFQNPWITEGSVIYWPECRHPVMSVMTPVLVSFAWNVCLETVSPLTCTSATCTAPTRKKHNQEIPLTEGHYKYMNVWQPCLVSRGLTTSTFVYPEYVLIDRTAWVPKFPSSTCSICQQET